MAYNNFREEKVTTTNFMRPRWKPGANDPANSRPMKALITVEGENKGSLCWGIVDDADSFVAENQQLVYNPYTGAQLPATLEELTAVIGQQQAARARRGR